MLEAVENHHTISVMDDPEDTIIGAGTTVLFVEHFGEDVNGDEHMIEVQNGDLRMVVPSKCYRVWNAPAAKDGFTMTIDSAGVPWPPPGIGPNEPLTDFSAPPSVQNPPPPSGNTSFSDYFSSKLHR